MMKNFMKVYKILVNITTYIPSLGNFLMNNTRDIHEKKIDNAPTIRLSLVILRKQTKNDWEIDHFKCEWLKEQG